MPRSRAEISIVFSLAILMRVGVRLEVRLLAMPADTESSGLVRDSLADLGALLHTLGGAIQRAVALQDKVDATLADA